KIWIFKTTS
ncbi:hypothetical protein ZOSMA_64G00390, partial [Zostera marina]